VDHRFTPLEERLTRIFGLERDLEPNLLEALCDQFLRPIFAIEQVYDDVVPVLTELGRRGYRTAIVSNAPWGSPPRAWRHQLRRNGLAGLVDEVVLCGDVGWRKPARQIFELAATRLDARCAECLFVGDDLQWDIAGSQQAGMRPVLMDREGLHPEYTQTRLRDLRDLLPLCPTLEHRT
jgi:putative hydrolase of the HAD superfamily